MKNVVIVDEVRKILQDEGLMISASVGPGTEYSCTGHAQMVRACRSTAFPLAAEEARDAFAQGEDIVLSEENEFPDSGRGCLRRAPPHLSCWHACVMTTVCRSKLQFWSVADNVRFGGALMAVKIAREDWCRSICTNVRPATTASL